MQSICTVNSFNLVVRPWMGPFYEPIHGRITCQPDLTTFPWVRFTNPSMDVLPANRTWQPSRSHGTYQHEAIPSRSRQLLMMGTWLPETCWATIRREIKNTKSDIYLVFLIHTEINKLIFIVLTFMTLLAIVPAGMDHFTPFTSPTTACIQHLC